MVEGGGGVEGDESGAVDGAARDLPRAAAHQSEDEQYNEADDAENQAYAMSDGVGELFDRNTVCWRWGHE